MTQTNNKVLYIFLLIAMLAWGASSVNMKILSSYINEYEMMLFRYFFTALTLIPIMIFLKKSFRIDFKSFIFVLISSILFIAYTKYFYVGIQLGTASLGGALVTTLVPINTFIFLAILGTKKITAKSFFALILGALGVLTMLNAWTFKSEEIFLLQNLYFILASLIWPIVTIISSKLTKVSPLTFTFYIYLTTSLINVIFFVDLQSINYASLDSIFYINLAMITLLATAFGNTIYFIGVEKLGAEVSSFIFLVPFSAIVLSAIFLQEEITISIVIGTILTISAVKILNNITIIKKKKSNHDTSK
ncbi:MAG: EamA family transporter [Arcobacter sp.]|nr:EamA family transporter [Arcobacter sp.]|tara:strand:- start:11550 stop:12461 length:912 start_codon:yes stop_codon:yes gene_type:complete